MSRSKKLETSLRTAKKAVEASMDRVRSAAAEPPRTAKVVGAAAAGVAGAAGIAAAVHFMRREKNGIARFSVTLGPDGDWLLATVGQKDDRVETFARKRDAVEAGRRTAREDAPSELLIHRADGSLLVSHSYEA